MDVAILMLVMLGAGAYYAVKGAKWAVKNPGQAAQGVSLLKTFLRK